MEAIAISAINFKEPKITRLRIERVLIWAKTGLLNDSMSMIRRDGTLYALYQKFPSRFVTIMTPPHILEFAIFHLSAQLSVRAIRFRQLSDLLVDQTIARVRGEQKRLASACEENSRLQPAANFPVRVCIRRASSRRGLGWKEPRGESTLCGAVRYARPLFISLSAPISKQNTSEARRQITDLATRRAFIGPLLRKFIAYPRYIESKHPNERIRCVPTQRRASYWIDARGIYLSPVKAKQNLKSE